MDRALRAARHAIELAPESAVGYQMLSLVQFARRDLPAAFAAAEKAVTLNPYDMRTLSLYGSRLIAAGEVDKGMSMLQRAAKYGAVRPHWEHFSLFLGHYLRGDLPAAISEAHQLTADTFPLSLLARTLAAAAEGNRDKARHAWDQLVAIRPTWRNDARGELTRLFSSTAIVDRLAADLAAAGLSN